MTSQPGPEQVQPRDSDDDDSWPSSDEDENKGPPPMLNIEKSADFKSMKTAILSAIEKPSGADRPPAVKPMIDIGDRMGKETMSNLTSTFEKLGADDKEKSAAAEKQVVVAGDKEQYSSFKEKFENIQKVQSDQQEQDKRASKAALDIQGLGAEGVSKAKDLFDAPKSDRSPERPKKILDIERSDADKKLVQKTFFETPEKEEPKNCAICDKTVYPVEKVLIEKRVYHKNCFNCSKCQKRLNVQNYSTHEGKIYCKLHALEIVRPDVALAYEKGEITEGDIEAELDEEGDYVLVSKPKIHDASVVKSSLKSTDDFETLGSLQERKSEWTKSVQDMGKPEKCAAMDENESKLFEQGRVKSHSTKFVEGEVGGEIEEDDEEPGPLDPNIVRSTKKKEKITVEVGAKVIKGKWESGTVERAQGEMEDRSQELDEVKRNVSSKEKFKEKIDGQPDDESNTEKRKSALAEQPVDTSFSHAAKESFLKGTAFQETKPIERTVVAEDIKFGEIGNVKDRFENRPLDEGKPTEKNIVDERCAEIGGLKAAFEQAGLKSADADETEAGRKKEQLEKEFQEIKQARREIRQARKSDAEKAEGKLIELAPVPASSGAELGSLKEKFEAGPAAFQNDQTKSGAEKQTAGGDVEIKVAGKARRKFKQIDQEGAAAAASATAAPATKTLEQSKWAKEPKAKPEPVNKRMSGPEEVDLTEEDDYEVKNLLNKFKNIEQGKSDDQTKGPKPKRAITPPPEGYVPEPKPEPEKVKDIVPSVTAEELASIKVEAKNLKAKFEQAASAAAATDSVEKDIDSAVADEKKRQLEEEFRKLKEMREEQKQAEPVEEPVILEQGVREKDADLALAAEHGQKSRAKWEKIEKKEAKKAQKAAAAARRPAQNAKKDS